MRRRRGGLWFGFLYAIGLPHSESEQVLDPNPAGGFGGCDSDAYCSPGQFQVGNPDGSPARYMPAIRVDEFLAGLAGPISADSDAPPPPRSGSGGATVDWFAHLDEGGGGGGGGGDGGDGGLGGRGVDLGCFGRGGWLSPAGEEEAGGGGGGDSESLLAVEGAGRKQVTFEYQRRHHVPEVTSPKL